MKYTHVGKTGTVFNYTEVGELFVIPHLYDWQPIMRTVKFTSSDGTAINAVNLSNGDLLHVMPDTRVERLEYQLTIK